MSNKDTIRALDTREQCDSIEKDRMYGKKFGRLTVYEIVYRNKHYMKKYRCVCDCGNETTTYGGKLTTGHTKSCGCLQVEKAREQCIAKTKYKGDKHFIQAWKGMKTRANDVNYSGYTPDFNWSYEEFKKDMYESYLYHVGKYGTHETTLDRIDCRDGYYKENCRWATRLVQNNNTSKTTMIEYNGMVKTFREWAKYFHSDIDLKIIKNRYNTYKWDIKRACIEPINEKFRSISHKLKQEEKI